jgi:O-antigen/teichoic acid export membrane protein
MTPESTAHLSAADARRAARNASAIAFANILSRGLQFGWQILFLRLVAEEVYGIYGAVSSFVQIGAIVASFGLGIIIIRDVARYPQRAGHYLSAALFVNTVLALLAYLGLNIIAAFTGYNDSVRVFLALAGLNLFIDTFGNIAFDQLLAREQMVTTSLISILHVLLLVVGSATGLLLGWSLVGVYAGTLFAGTMRALMLWSGLLRSGVRPIWPLDRGLTRTLLLNAAPIAVNGFFVLAYQQLDKLLTNRFIGNQETAYLSAAFLIHFGLVEVLNGTILTALYPLMSRASADQQSERFGFMVEKLTFFNLLLFLPLALILSLFAQPLILLILDARYLVTANLLSVMIWYALLSMTGNMAQQGFMTQNRQHVILRTRLVGLGINLVLLLVLLPTVGVIGAPIASLVAEVFVFSTYMRRFQAPGWERGRLLRRLGWILPAGVPALGVMLLLGSLHWVLGILGGVVTYGAAVLLLRVLSEDDWDFLYRLAAALPGGRILLRYWKRNIQIA